MILDALSLGNSLIVSHACEQIQWLFFFSSEIRSENVRKTLKENLIFDICTKRRSVPPLPSKTLHLFCCQSVTVSDTQTGCRQ